MKMAWPPMKLTGGGRKRWPAQTTMSKMISRSVATSRPSASSARPDSRLIRSSGSSVPCSVDTAVTSGSDRCGCGVDLYLHLVELGERRVEATLVAHVIDYCLQEGRVHALGHQVGGVETELRGAAQHLCRPPRDLVGVVGDAGVDRQRSAALDPYRLRL